MNLDYAAISDVGRVRGNNEDSFGDYFEEESEHETRGALFVVADGMGGHRGGEIASKIAVETIHESYFKDDNPDPSAALVNAFVRANKLIVDQAVSDPALFGMGTTCTSIAFSNGNASVVHVGDSRAYHLRDGTIEQVTNDHSLVGEMVRSGIISDEDARTHPKRNVITRSLGVQESVIPDALEPLALKEKDAFLLCSDGLTSYVTDEELGEALSKEGTESVCHELIALANGRGGRDNITVIVVRVVGL